MLVQVVSPPAVDTDFWNKAGLPVSNLPASAVMKPQHLAEAAPQGLDRGESWVFPSLSERPFGTIMRRRAKRSSEVL